MTLSAFLKKYGNSCDLIDIKLEKNYIQKIQEIKPDIIAYSVTSNNWKYYYDINLNLKKHLSFFSIFGGAHPTFFPDLIYENKIDAICRGEGEYAFKELAYALEHNEDYSGIKNLWVKQNAEEVIKNDLRPLIQDLDSLPFPDRDLIDKYKHYRKRSRIRTITSRGCPFSCTYCFNHAYRKIYKGKGKYVRQRSPAHVIEELKRLKKRYSPNNFEFHDDIFSIKNSWLQEFVKLYLSEKINIPFEVNLRPNFINEESVSLLKKAGCYSVQFGVESGNDYLRNEVLHRNISRDIMINAASLLRLYGIKINTYNLIGIPEETMSSVVETIKFNSQLNVNYAMNCIYQPYPGTKLSEYAINSGYYTGDFNELGKNYLYGKSAIHSKDGKRIERMHYLFSYGVKFPFLIPLLLFLSRLPLNGLYQALYFFYRAYSVIFIFKRLRIREAFIRERI